MTFEIITIITLGCSVALLIFILFIQSRKYTKLLNIHNNELRSLKEVKRNWMNLSKKSSKTELPFTRL